MFGVPILAKIQWHHWLSCYMHQICIGRVGLGFHHWSGWPEWPGWGCWWVGIIHVFGVHHCLYWDNPAHSIWHTLPDPNSNREIWNIHYCRYWGWDFSTNINTHCAGVCQGVKHMGRSVPKLTPFSIGSFNHPVTRELSRVAFWYRVMSGPTALPMSWFLHFFISVWVVMGNMSSNFTSA